MHLTHGLSEQVYMREMIRDRQKHDAKQGEDLLTSLLEASETAANEESDGKLTDEEVMGNIFIFLLAGHEVSLSLSTALFSPRSNITRRLRLTRFALLSRFLRCIQSARSSFTKKLCRRSRMSTIQYANCR